MAKNDLTKLQRTFLEAAARSGNLVAWPPPKTMNLRPGSAGVVIRALLQKGLLERRLALGSDPVWRETDGERLTLVITKAGLATCGVPTAGKSAQKGTVAAKQAAVAAVASNEPKSPRAGSKLAILIALLTREEGATVEEMAAATGWQNHTVRGTLSGAMAKRFQLTVVSRTEGRGRVYRAGAGSSTTTL